MYHELSVSNRQNKKYKYSKVLIEESRGRGDAMYLRSCEY